jgi:hypothetical protein
MADMTAALEDFLQVASGKQGQSWDGDDSACDARFDSRSANLRQYSLHSPAWLVKTIWIRRS